MSTYIDKSTVRKNRIVTDGITMREGLPMFSFVEFNTLAACTRKCEFCPVSDRNFYKNIDAKGKLDLDFYAKILGDLKAVEYHGLIMFSGFSEPLLHDRIVEIIAMSKRELPQARVEIISNGDLMTPEILTELFGAGLDTVNVSMYDGPEQIEKFQVMRDQAGLREEQVILRRRYFQDGNYGLTVSNRGGLLDSNKYRAEGEEQITELPLKKPCYYPFYMAKIDFNGDMLLCSHDWRKRFIIGNLHDKSIWELWSSDRLQEFKARLAKADRSEPPCCDCDVHGDVIGEASFRAWLESRGR